MRRGRHVDGFARDRIEDEACIFAYARVVELHHRRHAEDGKVERVAQAQFAIRAARVRVRRRNGDARHDIARTLGPRADAVVDVEILDRYLAFAGWSGQVDACPIGLQHRRGVGGVDRKAFGTASGDAADVAVFFHAVAQRFAPVEVLVVIIAARIDADVAADGAHVAQLRRGNRRCGGRESGIAAAHDVVFGDRRERGERAERQAADVVVADEAQVGDRPQADQHFGREQALLHVRVQVGAARHRQRVGAMLGEQCDGLVGGARGDVGERRQAQHERLFIGRAAGALPARRTTGLETRSCCPATARSRRYPRGR